jgi:hypothetical protein
MDFVLNLRTAFYDEVERNRLVTNQWAIFKNYAKVENLATSPCGVLALLCPA